jgi:zinc transport system ATP-binding protein
MQNLIELNHISAGYRNKRILSNVSINIGQRDFVGIIGPNGGGKTTLLRVILGMLKPDSGRMTFFNADGTEAEHIKMGYLPQHTQIDRKFPLSVKEVLRSGQSWSLKDVLHIGKKTIDEEQLNAVVERFHLENIVNCQISELSGGQIQRVLIARAVISRPDVVILDEPNTYIDLRFQNQTYEMLKSINDECAVIVVGHDIDALLNHAHSIVCLDHSAEQFDAKSISRETINKCFMQTSSSY